MIARLACGRSLTEYRLLWLPHATITASGLHRARFRPLLVMMPRRPL